MILIDSEPAAQPLGYGTAVLLGVVQGITEFLPISSTAHLKVVPVLLGLGDPGVAVSAVIQLGTMVAVLLYFARDILGLLRGGFAGLRGSVAHRRDLRLCVGIALGTVPVVAAGLLGKKWISHELRSLWVIAGALTFFGLLLALADRRARTATRTSDDVGLGDAILVGIAQMFALIPGASRSGVTMTGALFLGLERSAAARFSFLLSIPAITGAGLYELIRERRALLDAGVGPLVVATVVSGLVGFLSIGALLRFLRTRSSMPFVVYRIALAAWIAYLLIQGKLASG